MPQGAWILGEPIFWDSKSREIYNSWFALKNRVWFVWLNKKNADLYNLFLGHNYGLELIE